MNTVINRCAQGEFSAIEKLAEGVYRFGWGVQVEMLSVIENDAPTGEYVESGMVTYEATMFYGQPTAERITTILADAMRTPTLEEVDAMLIGIGASDDERLTALKSFKKSEIERYDKSSAVDGCYIVKDGQLITYWADKDVRDDLKGAVRDYIAIGKETYRLDLRELGMSLTIPCENLLSMLSALEVYAISCFNKTTDHLFAVDAMTAIDEVKAYEYTIGYPEKLNFNL